MRNQIIYQNSKVHVHRNFDRKIAPLMAKVSELLCMLYIFLYYLQISSYLLRAFSVSSNFRLDVSKFLRVSFSLASLASKSFSCLSSMVLIWPLLFCISFSRLWIFLLAALSSSSFFCNWVCNKYISQIKLMMTNWRLNLI